MRVLITAGPTQEAIDPVRYLSNHSSGKMGYALAESGIARGFDITLISGPVSLPEPSGLARLRSVISAEEMYQAVSKELTGNGEPYGLAIFCAAVADYRPATTAVQKIKKNGLEKMTLELEPTRDILGSARSEMGYQGVLVGFAAETENVDTNALDKLGRKKCDLLVANDVSRGDIGFGTEENEVKIYFQDRETPKSLPKQSKRQLADEILDLALRYVSSCDA